MPCTMTTIIRNFVLLWESLGHGEKKGTEPSSVKLEALDLDGLSVAQVVADHIVGAGQAMPQDSE